MLRENVRACAERNRERATRISTCVDVVSASWIAVRATCGGAGGLKTTVVLEKGYYGDNVSDFSVQRQTNIQQLTNEFRC
jgi:hypothetical protein